MSEKHTQSEISRRLHHYLPHLVALAVVITGIVAEDRLVSIFKGISSGFMTYFDWLIMLSCTGFMVFCLYLAFSRYGELRLGGADERPQFSTPSWLAMLFAAGMGIGLIFWGTAEPLHHMAHPPNPDAVSPNSPEAARLGMVITHLHRALHPWAIYAIGGLTVAYFGFRKQMPLLPSTPMRAMNMLPSKNIDPIIDTFAILAVVFGVVSSVGEGVMQIASGIDIFIPGIGSETESYVLVMLVMATAYMTSALSGINKGIKILSDINMLVCILLLAFVLFAGPTVYLMRVTVMSLGDYISQLPRLSFDLRLDTPGQGWTQHWTLTYFLWWVAWAPFVGVFIARISRGRTIRQFLTGVLFVPSLFSILWYAVMGGAGYDLQLKQGVDLAAMLENNHEFITYALLEHLPLTAITQLVVIFLVFIFLVTSADSGSYVLGMFSSHGSANPPKAQSLFWGVMIAMICLAVLVTGEGIPLLRAVVVCGAIPYLFIMLWQSWCLLKSLHLENTEENNQP